MSTMCCSIDMGSAITNEREPGSCLSLVFNSKLGGIATLGSKCMVCMQALLKLKTQHRAHPVSLRCVYTSEFRARFRIKLARFAK